MQVVRRVRNNCHITHAETKVCHKNSRLRLIHPFKTSHPIRFIFFWASNVDVVIAARNQRLKVVPFTYILGNNGSSRCSAIQSSQCLHLAIIFCFELHFHEPCVGFALSFNRLPEHLPNNRPVSLCQRFKYSFSWLSFCWKKQPTADNLDRPNQSLPQERSWIWKRIGSADVIESSC